MWYRNWVLNIPCFNPDDIKDILLKLVDDVDADIPELTPWYKNFKGKIINTEYNKWDTIGDFEIKGNTIIVKELPVGTWTEDYKTFLDKLETEDVIYSYVNNSTETEVNFEIKIKKDYLDQWKNTNTIEKKLKLITHLSAKNMHVFNEKGDIVKMESPEEIIYNFWKIRNEYYTRRKKNIIKKTEEKLNVINSKIRFVNDIIEDKYKYLDKKENLLLNN